MKTKFYLLVLLSVFCLSNIFAQIPTNGLVGYWPFNGNANDESGNNLNGVNFGAILTNDRFGIPNHAYYFEGSLKSCNIQIADNNLLDFVNNLSLCAWFKSNDTITASQGILGKGRPDGRTGYRLGFSPNENNGDFGMNNYGTNIVVDDKKALKHDMNWHFIVGTYNGVQAIMYLDGVLIASVSTTMNLLVSTQPLLIGHDSPAFTGERYFGGTIDDIRIYNRALTQNEITALYTECNTPPLAVITPQNNTTFCQGGFVNLNANTGTGYTYQWYKNGNLINNANAGSYQATESGSYTVKITEGTCSNISSPVVVTVNPIPSNVVTNSGSTTFCSGNSVTLTAQGTGTYLWSNGATTKSIIVTQSGNYSVTVSSNGCSSTSSITNVVVNPIPTASITATGATTFCQGGFVILNASGGGTYLWNTGVTTASITVNQTGTFSVIVSANNCTAIASQNVTVNPTPTVSLAPLSNFININANSVLLNGNPIGGIYSGSGVSGSSFYPTTAGLGYKTVKYIYTNSSGCSGNATQSTIIYDTTGTVCTSYISVTDTLIIKTTITGINPPNNLNTITVFPNPAKDHITINYGNYALMAGYKLKITNALGQEVFSSPINQQSSYVNLSTWTGRGIYFVNIIDPQNKTIDTRKIVLQ